MTVRELISKLQLLEQDQEILIEREGYAYDISGSIESEKVDEGNIGSTRASATLCYLLETSN